MDAIQQADDAVHFRKGQMVPIVLLGRLRKRQMQARVRVHGGVKRDDIPEQCGDRMHFDNPRSEHDWREIRHNMLDRMRIDAGPCERGHPLVVELVNASIEPWMMHDAMRVVKANLLEQDDGKELRSEARQRGQLLVKHAAHRIELGNDKDHWHANEKLIEPHSFQQTPHFLSRRTRRIDVLNFILKETGGPLKVVNRSHH